MTNAKLEDAADAIATVVHGWEVFMESSKPYQQAEAIRALQDAVSDLASWHPLYEPETGRIEDDSDA